MMERKMLTAAEVAEYIGVSKEKIYQSAREGTLPAVNFGRRVLFDKQSLDNHFANLEEAQLQEKNKKNTPLHGRIE